jgi:hypothetical protein
MYTPPSGHVNDAFRQCYVFHSPQLPARYLRRWTVTQQDPHDAFDGPPLAL